MMRRNILLAVALLVPAALTAQTKTYAVIVNVNNACTETGDKARSIVKKLFLKQLKKWPGGRSAKPYGRKKGPEMAAFLSRVLGMGDAELARHWLKKKNMDGATPPKEVSSARMTLKYVGKHEGALGIVALDEVKGEKDVRVLFEF